MTKKIAILTSNNSKILEAITEYFKDNKDVEITCLSDIVDSEPLKKAKELGIKNRYLPNEENTQYFGANNFDIVAIADYEQEISASTIECSKFINLHPSLLPAFEGKDSLQRAYTSGVKVSGITIHHVTDENFYDKIIAQYPVLIGLTTHFGEFCAEIDTVSAKVYPVVIDTLLNDKVFDFQDLFKSSCHKSGGCSGNCDNCH